MLNIGYEKVILMYNSATYSTADIFPTYVYRKGLLNAQYSFAAAVGLANSLINIVILLTANFTAKKMTDTSIFLTDLTMDVEWREYHAKKNKENLFRCFYYNRDYSDYNYNALSGYLCCNHVV